MYGANYNLIRSFCAFIYMNNGHVLHTLTLNFLKNCTSESQGSEEEWGWTHASSFHLQRAVSRASTCKEWFTHL